MSAARIVLASLALVIGFGSLGCDTETVHEEGGELVTDISPAPDAPAATEQQPAEVKAVELTTADNAKLQEIIAQHEGKIVIVDFWATWCTTCMALMPHTAEIQQQHAEDVVVITMCLDDADQAPTAKEFLARLDGEFINLLSAVGGGPKTLDEYDLGDGIPHYKFYDRQGKLAKTLDTDREQLANAENIEAAVKELLDTGN